MTQCYNTIKNIQNKHYCKKSTDPTPDRANKNV